MKLLIFLAIVAYVAGTSLIGSNKCTWGPGYWCSRVSHAKKCGAMEHCLNIFWPKQQIRTISSPSCTACKMAIGELRFSLKNSGTQKQVADFLAQFCTILPADEKRKCKSMVTDDLTGVLQLLNSDINSEVVCAAVDICMEDENNNQQASDTTATIVATTPSQDPTTQSPEKICTDCKTLVQDIKVVMTDNQTVIEVVEKLEQVICAKMGPLQFICKQVVEMYIPQYFKNLSTLIDPDMICTALGLCQNGDPFDNYSYSRLMTAMRSVIQDVAGTSCPIYKKFATEIQNIIRDENIQAAIGKTLNEICDLLPGEEDECRAFVQTHSQTVIQTILDVDFGEISNENQLYFQADALEVNAEINGVSCQLCQLVIKYAKTLLKNNSTVQIIFDELHKICAQLPGNIASQCNSIIDNYGYQLLQYLVKNLDAKQACQIFGLCPKNAESPEIAVGRCELCQMVITYAKTLLKNNATVQIIFNELHKACAQLPGNIASQCNSIIDNYGYQLLQYLINDVDPRQACQMFGLCPKNAESPEVAGGECELCQMVIKYAKTMLKNNSTVQIIFDELHKLCDQLPGNIASQCNSIIDNYGYQLLQYLVNDVDPKQACQIFGLCPKNAESQVAGGECELCQMVIKYAKTMLKNNSTVQIIFDELHKLCDQLPGNIASQCNSIIDNYGYQLLQYLINDVDPKQACQIFGLCPKNAESPVPKVEGVLCDECEHFLSKLKAFLLNGTEDEVIDVLKSICSILPSNLKDACDQMVDTYSKTVIDYILKMDPQAICVKIRMCSSMNKTPAVPKVEGVLCDKCEDIVSKLKEFLLSNNTEDEVIAKLKSICSILPSNLKDVCDEMVDKYSKEIIDYILKMDPQTICIKILMCSSMNKTPAVSKVEGILCDECEDFVSKLKAFLLSETEDEVIDVLKSICSMLPSNLRGVCDEVVDAYSMTVIDYILNMDPRAICVKIGMCSSMNKTPAMKKSKKECVICKMVSATLEYLLHENSTSDEIKKAVDVVCYLIGSELRSECRSFVSRYESAIISIFVAKLKPDKLCDWCNKMVISPVLKARNLKDSKCILCEYIMNELDSLVENNRSEAFIEKTLKRLCSLTSPSMKECNAFIDEYRTTIIYLLEQEIDPKRVCMKFGLCSGQRRMWKPPQPKPDVASLIFKKKSQRSKNVHMRRVSGVPVKRKRGSVMMRNIATWFGP